MLRLSHFHCLISLLCHSPHLLTGAGIHLVGGSAHNVITRTMISNTNFGMNIGFATELE
jgi:hypothetical protein